MLNKLSSEISYRDGFLIALAISIIFLYPIINADVYYIDDLARSQTGFLGWRSLGRPLSDYIFLIFGLKKGVTIDVSPLPQILSIVMMAATINHSVSSLFNTRNAVSISALSLVFINPLFLHNLVYRYDSLSMVLSVSACMLAITIHQKKHFIDTALKSVLIFSSLCFYQVSAVCFIMLCIVKWTYNVQNGVKLKIKDISLDIFSVVIGYVLYFLLVTSTEKTGRSETVFSQDNWLYLLNINFSKFIDMYSRVFDKHVTTLIILALLFSLIIYSLHLCKRINAQDGILAKVISCCLVFSPALLFIASISTVLILKESLILPRIATPFGIILFYAASVIYVLSKRMSFIFSFILLFYSVIISFALSAAMHDQYKNDYMLISQIKTYIEAQKVLRTSKTTTFGVARKSLVAKNNERVFPIIGMINSRVYDATASIMLTRIGLDEVNFSFERKKWMDKAISVCKTRIPEINNNEFSIYNKDQQNYVFLGKLPTYCLQK